MRYLFFTHDDCTACEEVRSSPEWRETEKDIEEIDVYTDDGQDLANEHGVRSVPTFVEISENGSKSMTIGTRIRRRL